MEVEHLLLPVDSLLGPLHWTTVGGGEERENSVQNTVGCTLVKTDDFR